MPNVTLPVADGSNVVFTDTAYLVIAAQPECFFLCCFLFDADGA